MDEPKLNPDFEKTLLEAAAPRLERLGYDYDAQLRLGNELFGFRKELGEDVHAIIQFSYRCDTARNEFTINLISARSHEFHPRVHGGYPGARGARLSYVLWFVHHLRDYAVPDYWWAVWDDMYLPAAIEEALGYLERYGVPWLEAPQAEKPWEMPVHHVGEFVEAVQAIIVPEMARLGYRPERQALANDLPYLYFSRTLPDGSCGLIEMQSIYSLDPNEFNFDVRLQRKPDKNPLSFSGAYREWRSASLAQLVWHAQGSPALHAVTVGDLKNLFWHYADRTSLEAQLRDALAQIKQIGLPWLEQAGVAL